MAVSVDDPLVSVLEEMFLVGLANYCSYLMAEL